MRPARGALPAHAALGMAVVGVMLAAFVAISLRSSSLRPLTIGGYCAAMPVYAGATGPFVGYLIGPATIESQGSAVSAINISVLVDGQLRSVWRRERDVRRWYTPRGKISPAECRWSRPLANDGIWKLAPLEFGLDARLWVRRFGRGWSSRRTFLTTNDTI